MSVSPAQRSCRLCHSWMPVDARFCGNCGKPMAPAGNARSMRRFWFWSIAVLVATFLLASASIPNWPVRYSSEAASTLRDGDVCPVCQGSGIAPHFGSDPYFDNGLRGYGEEARHLYVDGRILCPACGGKGRYFHH